MIDQKDKEILFELLQDCRKPVAKIAKAVKLPPQTTAYRIKKLEDLNSKYKGRGMFLVSHRSLLPNLGNMVSAPRGVKCVKT